LSGTAKPKIYVFVQSSRGDVDKPADPTKGIEWYDADVVGAAIAEDGTHVAGHLSSSLAWFRRDMGLTSTSKHDRYRAHYPDGYDLVEAEPPAEVLERAGWTRTTEEWSP